MDKRVRPTRAFSFLLALIVAFVPATSALAADTTPPTSTLATPTTLSGSLVVTFSEPVKNVSVDNVGLRLDGTTANLAASLSCRSASNVAVGCGSGPATKAIVTPSSALVPGGHYAGLVNVGGTAPLTDLAGNAAGYASKWFYGSTLEEEQSVAASYRWATGSSPSAYGGSYSTERLAGARATYRFTGRSVAWYTITGPDQGFATLSIDGHSVGSYDLYSATRRYHAARAIGGLGSGSHRLVIAVKGTKRSASHGTFVTVDAFTVDGVLDATPNVEWRWRIVDTPSASGGHLAYGTLRGSNVYFTFRGPGVDWATVTGPDQGSAQVFVDGVLRGTYDNYSSSVRYGVLRSVRNLTVETHTLRVVVTGKKRSASRGTFVGVDRFIVRLVSIAAFRYLGAWVDLFDYGLDPHNAIADMKSHGVKTVYLETARYSSSADFDYPTKVDAWLLEAHNAGIKVIGWYFPAYSEYLNTDVRRTVAIALYRSPAGERFDGLGIDIEYKGKTSSASEFNSGIVTHLDRVRSGAGSSFTIAAIVPAPVAMALSPSSWQGFPWAAIGTRAHVVLPMAYSSYRTDCSTKPAHCPYRYTIDNVNEAHRLTGLPVHVIGGVGDRMSSSQVSDFVNGARAAHAYGGSLYDYRTTASSFWQYLSKLNLL